MHSLSFKHYMMTTSYVRGMGATKDREDITLGLKQLSLSPAQGTDRQRTAVQRDRSVKDWYQVI